MKCDTATRAALQQFGEFDAQAEERLAHLANALVEESATQNLVASASLPVIWQRHFLDSAQLLRHVPRETTSWLDLGTGAGFPGLVISILRSDLPVFMVESRKRRVEWLHRMVTELDLRNAEIFGSRLENINSFDAGVISARAFAPLAKLLDLSARFSTSETIWLLPKGRSAAQELEDLHGWRHSFHVEQSLTDPEAGVIVGTLAGKKVARA